MNRYLNRLLSWWIYPRGTMIAIPFIIVIVQLATFMLSSITSKINALTNVDLGDVPAYTRVMLFAFSALLGLFFARGWFGASVEMQNRIGLFKMRRDRMGIWLLVGIAHAMIISASSFWLSKELMGVVAQHLDGTEVGIIGTVTTSYKVITPNSPCRYDLVVRATETNERLSICLFTYTRSSLSESIPLLGDEVYIHAKQTVLGRVVLWIDVAKKRNFG
ncbi:MAG: hypothetical protein ABUS47_16560 [Steroidobacter sp.]